LNWTTIGRKTAEAATMDAETLVAPGAEQDLARHIIEFDPRSPSNYVFSAAPHSEEAVALAQTLQPDPIPWPAGLKPDPIRPAKPPADTDPLPKADVLVVTYTVAEGYALADVLTPGWDGKEWFSYRNGWDTLRPLIEHGAPSLAKGKLRGGTWATTKVGNVKAVLVKSDLHPSTDGEQLPIRILWRQMIEQVQPKLVITTGTAGGIGAETLLGDVIVSQNVRWDCSKTFAHAPFAHDVYACNVQLKASNLEKVADDLISVNAAHLPSSPRNPVVVLDTVTEVVSVISTDIFAFDDAADSFKLRTVDPKAHAVEMDDAALALACTDIQSPPAWAIVRNASDPQMTGGTVPQEKKEAAAIYEKYGYWTTIGSAITCAALISQAT
jgi:nucleoside phosphorylase